jgi:hypothetical protein
MGISWVSAGYQLDISWVSDGYQLGISWISAGYQLGISSHSTHNRKHLKEKTRSGLNKKSWMVLAVNSRYLSYLMTPYQLWVSGIVVICVRDIM